MQQKLLLTLFLLSLFTGKLFAQCGKFEPPAGKALLILGQDMGATGGFGSPNNNGYYENVVSGNTALTPGGITTYTQLQYNLGISTTTNYGAGDLCAQCYVSNPIYNNSAISIGLYLSGDLSNVLNGLRNTEITNLANWIKQQNPRPVFLRIGYEFNYPSNNYPAAQYISAWKYIVDRFRAINVPNVAFVWQSDGGNASESTLMQWYPGDTYVDWVAISYFRSYSGSMPQLARNRKKPMMIAESTPMADLKTIDGNTAWNSFYAPFFSFVKSNNDVIKAVAYINQNWDAQSMWQGQGFGDSRVQVNAIVKQKWLAEVSTSFWLNASSTLFQTLTSGCNTGTAPVANFNISSTSTCVNTAVTVSNASSGDITSYSWNFGTDATPATATGSGPFNVSYSTAGTKTITLTVNGTNGSNTSSKTLSVTTCNPGTSTPYGGTARNIPGKIEAEFFDNGGQGIAYYDSSPKNLGAAFRTSEGVDIGSTSDAGGGYTIGWTTAGEWLKYTVNVTASGYYSFDFRVGSPYSGKSFHIDLNNTRIATVNVPNTGNFETYQTVTINNINLTAGSNKVITIYFDTDGFNLNYFNVRSATKKKARISTGNMINSLKVYPNPASNQLSVALEADDKETLYYEIVNILGTVVQKKQFISTGSPDFSEKLDISEFPAGIYFITIGNGEQTATKRFIKQ